MVTKKYFNFHVRTYDAQPIGAITIIKHLIKTPCSAAKNTVEWDPCIPQEYPNHIILWTDPHNQWQEMSTREVCKIQEQETFILIPSLHVVDAISEKPRLIGRTIQLDNGLVIRHIEVVKSFLQGFLDIVTKYAITI